MGWREALEMWNMDDEVYPDSYQKTNQFVAVALTSGYVLTKEEASSFERGTDADDSSSPALKWSRVSFRGRILGRRSPHSFLEDPCDLAETTNVSYVSNLIAQHTEFILSEDFFEGNAKANIERNDRVNVYLEPGPGDQPYNLERGWGLSLNQKRRFRRESQKIIDCVSIRDIWDNAIDFDPQATPIPTVGSSGGGCKLGRSETSKNNPNILYVGDSQMVGALGTALMKVGGPGNRLAKSSTNPGFWTDGGQSGFIESDTSERCNGADQLRAELDKNPTKIIISLGDNGPWGHEALIALIQEESPNAEVIWSGKSPPIYGGTGFDYTNPDAVDEGGASIQPGAYQNAYSAGSGYNDTLRQAVEAAGWTFYDPYDFFEGGGYEGNSGYECNGCDGIHVPSGPASDYAEWLAEQEGF